MSKFHRAAKCRTWIAAAIAAVVSPIVADAAPTAPSIAVNFGANEPDAAGSAVTGPAGVLGTRTWNNTSGAAGTTTTLQADVAGTSTSITTSLSWAASAGTWASTGKGEENNTAPAGGSRNLMAGYLDTTGTDPSTVTVTNLPSNITSQGYRVFVYHNGGVQGRGGVYDIPGATLDSQTYTDSAPFTGVFALEEDYQVFDLPAGTTEFMLTATPTIGAPARAPINGIEIVGNQQIPEPSAIAVLGLLGGGLLARRSRRPTSA